MFSVIIPAYNSGKTIKNALDSLLMQTRLDLIQEVIVVDDGSTDDTAGKVEGYCLRKKDSSNGMMLPIILIQQTNAGPAAARNAGMRRANGQYIAFLDADDEWVAEKIEKQASVLEKNPNIDLLCGGMDEGALKLLFRKYDTLYHMSLKDYCIKSIIFTSTVVIKRACIHKVGYFDETMRFSEDMNYYQRFFENNAVYYLPEKMVNYGRNREYYGQSGLSSCLKEMHRGRRYNFKVLRKERQISIVFYFLMVMFGEIKYFRRKVLVAAKRRESK